MGNGGGGGSAYGGAVFVRQGGSLTLVESQISSSSVTPGTGGSENTAGGSSGADGNSDGAGMYVDTGTVANFQFYTGTTVIRDTIAGTGGISLSGDGSLLLTGANTYTGGTTVNSGSTILGSIDSVQGNILNNGTVAFLQESGGGTISGNISGTGSVSISGAGAPITLTGANSYTGGTLVEGAPVIGTTNSLQGNISNASSIQFNQSTSGIYSGNMVGQGSVVVNNSGVGTTTTFTGSNSYTGGTTVYGGTLAGNTQSLQGNFANNSSIAFNQSTSSTYSGTISGIGGVEVNSSGAVTTTFTGPNSYTGGTTVNGGTLAGNTTSLQGNIVNNGNVTFNETGNGTYAGILSGAGSVILNNVGATTTFTGAVNVSGGITVNGGILVGNSASLQSNISDNGNVTFNQVGPGTYAGAISGSGSVSVANGELTLTGNNTYTGGTNVAAGSNLIGGSGSVQGPVQNDGSVTLNLVNGSVFDGSISGSGSVVITGNGNSALEGSNTYTGGTFVQVNPGPPNYGYFYLNGTTRNIQGNISLVDSNTALILNQSFDGLQSGVISGAGSVSLEGPGTVIFTGANTYTGGTWVNDGTLLGTTAGLQGNINNNGSVAFFQNTPGVFSGTISGNGSVSLLGTGAITFAGQNTYSGDTLITAGSLVIPTNLPFGNVTIQSGANLTYTVNQNSYWTGSFSGNGSLTIDGGSQLTLAGGGQFNGTTFVESGAIFQSYSPSLLGDIVNNAEVGYNLSQDGSYDGSMSGTGVLNLWIDSSTNNTYTLTLGGANSYTGGTNVYLGTLQGTTSSLQGDIYLQGGGGSLVFNQSAVGSYDGAISGGGDVTVTGAGFVTFSGANTYTGGTTVSGGTLQGTTTSLQGQINNNARLVFDQDSNGTYSGVMSGVGSVTKSGAGTVTFSAANTYSGDTSVTEGSLIVNGAIGSHNTSVDEGATLGGNGTVAGNLVADGAISPGNSIGTLDVGGDYQTSATSSIVIETAGSSAPTPGVDNDLLAVNGTAILNGGTVEVQRGPGVYRLLTRYTFLTASSVTGAYDGLVDDLPVFQTVLGYTADTAFFELLPDFDAVAQTYNERRIGNYLNAIASDQSAEVLSVLDQISLLSADEARIAYNQMDGDVHPTLCAIGVQNTTLIVQQLATRMRPGQTRRDEVDVQGQQAGAQVLVSFCENGSPIVQFQTVERQTRWSGWSLGYGIGGNAGTDGNAAGLNYGLGGTLLGLERWLDDSNLLGFYGGYVGTNVSTFETIQSGQVNGGQFGSYLSGSDGVNYYLVLGGLEFDEYSTKRAVTFGSPAGIAQANYDGWQGYAYLERGMAVDVGATQVLPFAALQYIYLRQNAFEENGVGVFDLDGDGIDANSLRSLVGLRWQSALDGPTQRRWLPELHALWLHEFLETDALLTARFGPIGGSSFAIEGLSLGRDWAILGGGFNWQLSDGWSLLANYDAQVNTQQIFHVGSGGLQYTW